MCGWSIPAWSDALAPEALAEVHVLAELGGEELQRDGAVERRAGSPRRRRPCRPGRGSARSGSPRRCCPSGASGSALRPPAVSRHRRRLRRACRPRHLRRRPTARGSARSPAGSQRSASARRSRSGRTRTACPPRAPGTAWGWRVAGATAAAAPRGASPATSPASATLAGARPVAAALAGASSRVARPSANAAANATAATRRIGTVRRASIAVGASCPVARSGRRAWGPCGRASPTSRSRRPSPAW